VSQRVELHVEGMDCVECTQHVGSALRRVPGVNSVEVFLASERAILDIDEKAFKIAAAAEAVSQAGYRLVATDHEAAANPWAERLGRTVWLAFASLSLILLVAAIGEWLGWFAAVTRSVPVPLYVVMIMLAGWPIFLNVIRAARQGRIISHTLMTIGMLAAILVGEWASALLVVFFMRVGDATERITAAGARSAIKDLSALAPQTARLQREAGEVEVPIEEVTPGDVVIVRPGERIPVDGLILDGTASVDASTITGESLLLNAGPGSQVYATCTVYHGSVRVEAVDIGQDSTFGRVLQLVEEAEANRGPIQRFADRFSGMYLPIVALIALLTLILRHDALAAAAVLVVVCSCAIAMATPIAVLASIGSAAKRGILIKGGQVLETLPHIDIVLIDKTGTLTLGEPQITDIQTAEGYSQEDILLLAVTVERYAAHPLADAVRIVAAKRNIHPGEPEDFTTIPGIGAQARIDGRAISVGNKRILTSSLPDWAVHVEGLGLSLVYVTDNGLFAGVLTAADCLRADIPESLNALREIGLEEFEILSGDRREATSVIADTLGVPYQGDLLPEDKIRIVRAYQAAGSKVAMIGDGINDAPALAQADVGIAMGSAGSEVAIEAAHVSILSSDWRLLPVLFETGMRTMAVVRTNLVMTGIYNGIGILLAAFGLLPPFLAAAAQSLPDLGILLNASRLLRRS